MSRESIRARLADATPGPWLMAAVMEQVLVRRVHRDEMGRRVTTFLAEVYDCRTPGAVDPVANGALIAHAPTDLAALLAVADVAAAVVDLADATALVFLDALRTSLDALEAQP